MHSILTLRKKMRYQRQLLSENAQCFAQQKVLHQIKELPEMLTAQKIGIYYANEKEGELRTQKIIHYLWAQGKEVYLPYISSMKERKMRFFAYGPQSQLIKNKFGLWEPDITKERSIEIDDMDLIFVPLVAFDKENHRIGMGGGFYDRILVNWQKNKKPLPIGLAHHCQYVDKIDVQIWDIPLAKVCYF